MKIGSDLPSGCNWDWRGSAASCRDAVVMVRQVRANYWTTAVSSVSQKSSWRHGCGYIHVHVQHEVTSLLLYKHVTVRKLDGWSEFLIVPFCTSFFSA